MPLPIFLPSPSDKKWHLYVFLCDYETKRTGDQKMSPLCLNVGCHDIPISGFTNIDLDPKMKPDLVWDATKLREKFQDDSVDFIYCGHFLEHLTGAESQQVVKDFYSILRPYGSVVAVIPDYTKTSHLSAEETEPIILAGGLHKSLFNEKRLLTLFKTVGFTAWPVDVKDIPWARFSQVIWQTATIGIKHPPVTFPQIKL
jgi:predicted SAM-dependent methyltransferase